MVNGGNKLPLTLHLQLASVESNHKVGKLIWEIQSSQVNICFNSTKKRCFCLVLYVIRRDHNVT